MLARWSAYKSQESSTSSSRIRLLAALVFDGLVAAEINALRKALRDPAILRIAPHMTLVPPFNLRTESLPEALQVLRQAGASAGSGFRLTLGPPATFHPAERVIYLTVGGDMEPLSRLQRSVSSGVLGRPGPTGRPWEPHVTIGRSAEAQRTREIVRAIAGYTCAPEVDRVVLMEQRVTDGRNAWIELADSALEAPAVVGRGGLETELTRGRLVCPEAAALLPELVATDVGSDAPPLVVTARREGGVVGIGRAWLVGGDGHVCVFVDSHARGQGVGSAILARVEHAYLGSGWPCRFLRAVGPAAFYERRSAYSKVTAE